MAKPLSDNKGYLPIELTQVALCPLSFAPIKLIDHIIYKHPQQNIRLLQKDRALESLLVGDELDCWKHYKYWDHNENRKVGHVNVKAPFGIAPEDFDVVVGLYNHCRDLDRSGRLPTDSQFQLSLAEIARICRLPHGGGKQALYLRSRLFRLGFVTLHFTAQKDFEEGIHVQRTFKFFTIKSLSRLNTPKQKIVIQLDPSFVDLIKSRRVIQFDRTFYDSLSAKHKRHYLQCVRYGWYSKTSPPDIMANDYACNQIWFADHDEQTRRSGGVVDSADDRTHQRVGWLGDLLKEAEADFQYVQPTTKSGWRGDYLKRVNEPNGTSVWYVRWANGKRIRNKRQRNSVAALKNDPLWRSVQSLSDDQGASITPATYHTWIENYGAIAVQKQLDIVQWMIANKVPFTKSAVHALVDRLLNNHAAPDGFIHREDQQQPTESDTRDPRMKEAYDTIIKSV